MRRRRKFQDPRKIQNNRQQQYLREADGDEGKGKERERKSAPLSIETSTGALTGMTSLRSPAFCALAALWCDLKEKASWAARVTPKAEARRSAENPIVSPEENSATAGS